MGMVEKYFKVNNCEDNKDHMDHMDYGNYHSENVNNNFNNPHNKTNGFKLNNNKNRSTSFNTGPFSIHQLENRLKSTRPMTVNSSRKNFNKHNIEIISSFQKKNLKSNKMKKFNTNNNQKYSNVYLESMKDLEKTTSNMNFIASKTKNNFFIEGRTKKYDGFESFNIPNIPIINNSTSRCGTAMQQRATTEGFYQKNYTKLLNSVAAKNKMSNLDERAIEAYCKLENEKLQRIIHGNNQINELTKGVKLSSIMTPSIHNIISAPKTIFKRTGLGGASRQMGDHYTPGLVVSKNAESSTKRNCFGGVFQY